MNTGSGSHVPGTAMSLAEESVVLRRQVKEHGKEICRLKEENEFIEETSALTPPAIGSQQEPENEFSCLKDRRQRDQRKTFLLLQDAESDSAKGLQIYVRQKSPMEYQPLADVMRAIIPEDEYNDT